MRLRRNVQNAVDETGNPPGNLLQVPSVLHGQAETCGYGRPCRKIPEKVQQENYLRRGGTYPLSFKYLKHLLLTATCWALQSSEDDILVGGQAVIEGVMMRSPKGYSVAVRRQDGTVRVMKDVLASLAEKWKIFKAPVIRGVGVLAQALVLGIRALRFSAEEALTEESAKAEAAKQERKADPAQVSSWLIAGNLVIALVVNLALF